ncbi:MAG TPA: hypothetical protein ENN51_05165 [candidate division WOR-3 bacterium]|uniref:Uncharacterized protein n=1 Tax=candidate division WOR-3 bacterium TaxID=2052148 RepID=A0A7V0T5P1_UNCW3|nr:hypothetical protein [candidate division WOR-3 bacterium]
MKPATRLVTQEGRKGTGSSAGGAQPAESARQMPSTADGAIPASVVPPEGSGKSSPAPHIQDWLDFGDLMPNEHSVMLSEGSGDNGEDRHHRPRYRRRPGELHQPLPVRCHGSQ